MATIYVRPTGNDTTGDGSLGNPYLTASKAASVAVNLDFVDVDGAINDVANPANFANGVSLFLHAGASITSAHSELTATKGCVVRVGGTVSVTGGTIDTTHVSGASFGWSVVAGQATPPDGSVITVLNQTWTNKIDGIYIHGGGGVSLTGNITLDVVNCSALGGFDNVQINGFAAGSTGSVNLNLYNFASVINYTRAPGPANCRSIGATQAQANIRVFGGSSAVAGNPLGGTYFANIGDPHDDPGNYKNQYATALWTDGANVEAYGHAVTPTTGYDDTNDVNYPYDPAGGYPSVPTTFDAYQSGTGVLKAYSCTGITRTSGTVTTGHCPQYVSAAVTNGGTTLTLTFTSADTGTLANLDSTKFTVAGQTLSAGTISGLTVTHTMSPGMNAGTSAALGIGYQGVKDGNGVSVQAIHPLQGVAVSAPSTAHPAAAIAAFGYGFNF